MDYSYIYKDDQQPVKNNFSFGIIGEKRGNPSCPRGNLYCKVFTEKEKHFHCDTCCSPEIFTSEEELSRHRTKHYL